MVYFTLKRELFSANNYVIINVLPVALSLEEGDM